MRYGSLRKDSLMTKTYDLGRAKTVIEVRNENEGFRPDFPARNAE